MGIGVTIERALSDWRRWRRERQPGPLGEFHRSTGDALLTGDLPVASSDTVLDVGGYQGNWTSEMLSRYGCRSVIFEPVPEFAASIRRRFHSNDRVQVFEAGLAAQDTTVDMYLSQDGSSVFNRGSFPKTSVRMRDVTAVFGELDLAGIACMKINIEGGEFDLLDRMFTSDLHKRTRCFLIQFHDVSSDSASRRTTIQSRLAAAHRKVFDYPFVWERWDKGQ